nr:pyrimidine-nucleoside phosphorylase [Haloplasma contractile]
MVDLILKKRQNIELTETEINWMIEQYTNEDIPDYQMSSMAMAIVFNGMTDKEKYYLTNAMVNSGDRVDLSAIEGKKVDKHSTGGVGDKTSLTLGPLVASCGAKLAKMSGRGLGHTGGTLDKLESIKGFNINVSEDDFIKQVKDIGIAIIGQTKDMCPADKKLYALRDVTGTVESIPLIASSIMSKKIAAGADTIVLDVKVGSGAFMEDIEKAKALAKAMVNIGKQFERNTTALITNMDQPLGKAVGNSLEVIEAIETLKGNGPKDFEDLCIDLAAHILLNAGIVGSYDEGVALLKEKIKSGEALNKFKDFISAQGGDATVVDDYTLLPTAKYQYEVKAKQDGFVKKMNALAIGNYAMTLGAGRLTKDASIDLAVGVLLDKKIGDDVKQGGTLAVIHSNNELTDDKLNEFYSIYKISSERVEKPKLIFDAVQ